MRVVVPRSSGILSVISAATAWSSVVTRSISAHASTSHFPGSGENGHHICLLALSAMALQLECLSPHCPRHLHVNEQGSVLLEELTNHRIVQRDSR